jgi:ADP-ribose pyrophosphatase YjhB (NUDIX family)
MKKIYVVFGRVLYLLLFPLLVVYLRGTSRAYVAIIYDKKLILIKNWLALGNWRLPGGGLNKGEVAMDAVIREIKEELRLVLRKSELVYLNEGTKNSAPFTYKYTNFAYTMSTFPKRLEDKFEIVDYGLFEELPSNLDPDLDTIVQLLRKKNLL